MEPPGMKGVLGVLGRPPGGALTYTSRSVSFPERNAVATSKARMAQPQAKPRETAILTAGGVVVGASVRTPTYGSRWPGTTSLDFG